jgi:hypothetical protein
MRFIALLILALAATSCLKAQESTCGNLIFEDRQMPTYAPIAKAAHIQGVVNFEIHIAVNGKAEIKLLDGLPFLAGAAENYLSARRHYWSTEGEHKSCSYITKIEYRIIQPESDTTNNFHRVTVLGPGYALVETQNQKPTCSDCASDECSMVGVSEAKQPTFPPIARAARVSGEVSARIAFDKTGHPTGIDQIIGPQMLRAATEEYLQSWQLKPLKHLESCHVTVLMEYRLTAATEAVESDVKVHKADATHILVEDHSVLTMDPSSTIITKKRFRLF